MTPIHTEEVEVPTGFAGMSSMVSDVDALLAAARRAAVPPGPTSPPIVRTPAAPTASVPPRAERPDASPLSAGSAPWTPYGWAVGTLILFVMGTMIYSEMTKQSVSAPVPSKPVPPLAPSPQMSPGPSPDKPAQRVREEKPPVGKDHILSRTQIQYCLAENIRLEAGQVLVHDTDDVRAVLRFNNLIDDYNSRCGEFRYHRSVMEAAKQDVERQRPALQEEGLRRLQSTDTQSPRVPSSSRTNKEPMREPGSQFDPPQEQTEKESVSSPVDRTSATRDDRNAPKGPAAAALSTIALRPLNTSKPVAPTAQPDMAPSLERCFEGRYPALCKQEFLTASQTEQAAAAEETAKLTQCLDGRSPGLCKDQLPTPSKAETDEAERAANLQQCLDGRYPALCNHALLTPLQADQVASAERRANLKQCLTGEYPFLCNHDLLSPAEAHDVEESERRVMFAVCLEGKYPALCKETLLTPDQRQSIRAARASAQQRDSQN